MLRLIYKYLKKRIMTYKVNKHGPIEVNITTDSGIYRDIIARYPSIKVNYFELGIGDYSLILQIILASVLCLFIICQVL